MSDMLIRNLPDQMRIEIRNAAAQSGRSLSEGAKHLIRKGLTTPSEGRESGNSAWDELRYAFGNAQLSDSEHDDLLAATMTARQSVARRTPDFE